MVVLFYSILFFVSAEWIKKPCRRKDPHLNDCLNDLFQGLFPYMAKGKLYFTISIINLILGIYQPLSYKCWVIKSNCFMYYNVLNLKQLVSKFTEGLLKNLSAHSELRLKTLQPILHGLLAPTVVVSWLTLCCSPLAV